MLAAGGDGGGAAGLTIAAGGTDGWGAACFGGGGGTCDGANRAAAGTCGCGSGLAIPGKPARQEVGPTAAGVLQSGFANLLWAALMA